ncbi:unnamed protein product [Clavelina lepadiformis]|uniref:Uncharacterized protein n=1 Tax=Clavelina lepadiformis TaxID=159417 RepID=A0ABP0FUW6_CLALP
MADAIQNLSPVTTFTVTTDAFATDIGTTYETTTNYDDASNHEGKGATIFLICLVVIIFLFGFGCWFHKQCSFHRQRNRRRNEDRDIPLDVIQLSSSNEVGIL